MVFETIKKELKEVLNWESFVYLIHVYLECLVYLLPAIISHLLLKNTRITLFFLALMIIIRLGVAIIEMIKSGQNAPKILKYSYSYRGVNIDEIEKLSLVKNCEIQYR
jgi:hypothetical protein